MRLSRGAPNHLSVTKDGAGANGQFSHNVYFYPKIFSVDVK